MKLSYQLYPGYQPNKAAGYTSENTPQTEEGGNLDSKKFIKELERDAHLSKLGLLPFLKGLPAKDIVVMLTQLNLSEKRLDFLLATMAIDSEENEICEAIRTIKNNKKILPKNDQADHLNYLDL